MSKKKTNRKTLDPKKLDFTSEEARKELKYELRQQRTKRTFRSTVSILITAAAIAVLIANLYLPILHTYGTSMTPLLEEGDYTAAIRGSKFETGDVIAFYYNNRILIKRVIAGPGDWVFIDDDGVVSVNNEVIDEPYVSELAKGDVTIELPYQVPEGRWFVLGDHREVSLDSRSKVIGDVAQEQVIGKLIGVVWPLDHMRLLS